MVHLRRAPAPFRRRHALRALFVAAGFVGCSFPLERTAGLSDGEIRFAPRRADGSLAEGAVAAVTGSARVTALRADRRGDDDAFVLAGLVPGRFIVRVSEDEDGDGVAERGAFVQAALAEAPVKKNLSDGCTGTPPPVVTSVILGDVPLADTGAVDVTFQILESAGGAPRGLLDGEAARVVLWRDLGGTATALEGSAPAAADGSATLAGVIPGTVRVAVFVFNTAEGPGKPTFFGGGQVDVTAGASAALDLLADEPARVDAGGTLRQRTTPVQLEAQWSVADAPEVGVVQASFTVPHGGADIVPPVALGARLDEDNRALVVDAPIGVVDLLLTSETEGVSDGALLGVVVVPAADGASAVLAPVELPVLADFCVVPGGAAGARDCDHDGVLADDDDDDDADGQADADEPEGCLGPGLGTDRDGDELCEPIEDPS